MKKFCDILGKIVGYSVAIIAIMTAFVSVIFTFSISFFSFLLGPQAT